MPSFGSASPHIRRAIADGRRGGASVPATNRVHVRDMTAGKANLPWPGITDGHDARRLCTWAFKDGIYQVKHLHGTCPVREHGRAGRG